VRDHRGYCTV